MLRKEDKDSPTLVKEGSAQNFGQMSPSSSSSLLFKTKTPPLRPEKLSSAQLVGIDCIKKLPYYKESSDSKGIESDIKSFGFCISPLGDQEKFKISFKPQHTIKKNGGHLSETTLETTLLTITSEGVPAYPHEKSKNKFHSLYPGVKKAIKEAVDTAELIGLLSPVRIS